MFLDMCLRRMICVLGGMRSMGVRQVGMMSSLLMMTGIVMFCRFFMMLGRFGMMFGRVRMMLGSFLGHRQSPRLC